MNKQELKEWFWNLYNSCYKIEEDFRISFFYDENYIRSIKLSNILETNEINPNIKEGKCLFYIFDDQLYCSEYIWLFLRKNYFIII